MPSIARSSIISGPARISFGGQTFWSKGDVQFNVINDRFNIDTAHFGKVDERFSDRRIEIVFEPAGAFTAGVAAVLWPYASTVVGASIFGASDTACTINGRDGRQIVVHAAAVTKMPAIRLGVTQTMIGSMTITGLVKNNTDPTNAAAYYTESAVDYPGDAGFAVSDILTKAYSAAWGASSPWNSFTSESGFTVDFNLGLAPQKVDGIGTVDMTFQSLEVNAKCIPVGPTAADILSKVAGTAGLGASIATADNLNISATGVYVRLYKAALADSGLLFGNTAKRIKGSEFIATRGITSGTADPLFHVGTSAPA
jgi:hypothetical protein